MVFHRPSSIQIVEPLQSSLVYLNIQHTVESFQIFFFLFVFFLLFLARSIFLHFRFHHRLRRMGQLGVVGRDGDMNAPSEVLQNNRELNHEFYHFLHKSSK